MTGTAVTDIQGGAKLMMVAAMLDGRTLINQGMTAWSGGGGLMLSHGAHIENQGTFTTMGNSVVTFAGGSKIDNDGTWNEMGNNTFRASGPGMFNNNMNASFHKLGSNGTSDIGVPFNNTGTVKVDAGTLALGGGGNSHGTGGGGQFVVAAKSFVIYTFGNYKLDPGTTIVGAGTAVVAGATVTVNSSVSATNFQIASGKLDGSGNLNIASNFTATGGSLAGTGMINVSPQAVANVSGTVKLTGGRRVVPVSADLTIATPATTVTIATATAGGGLDPQQFPSVALPWRIATFSDGDQPGQPGSYTATIDWGDGSTSAGTVIVNTDTTVTGTFAVISAPHTYAREGTYSLHVQISDPDGESAATDKAQVVVNDARLTIFGRGGSVVLGQSFGGSVASFSDPGGNGHVDDYTATIDWGDGTDPTTGSVRIGPNGTYEVFGTHIYATSLAGTPSFDVTVTVHDAGGQTAHVTTNDQDFLYVSDLQATPVDVLSGVTETGASFNGVLATFNDSVGIQGTDTSPFSATVNGQPATIAPVPRHPGLFSVSGTVPINGAGDILVQVNILDNNDTSSDDSQTTVVSRIAVAEAPLTLVGHNITVTAGNAFRVAVASFTDPGQRVGYSDYPATIIDWGDGTVEKSTNYYLAAGDIGDIHTYKLPGTYQIHVTVQNLGGSPITTTATATVLPSDLRATGQTIYSYLAPDFNNLLSGVMATFRDTDGSGGSADYSATITWQDHTSEPGTIVDNGDGTFSVVASRTYFATAATGTAFSVQITDADGNSATALGQALIRYGTHVIHATEGTLSTDAAYAFTPNQLPGNRTDYTVTINWGDGTSSPGVLNDDAFDEWRAFGQQWHTYAEEGIYPVTVNVYRASDGTLALQASNMAFVADATPDVSLAILTPTVGTPFSGTIATFTDAGTDGTRNDYTATIDWGDGQITTNATIQPAGSQQFNIIAGHIYGLVQPYSIRVIVHDAGGASTETDGTVTVAPGPLDGHPVTFNAGVGTTFGGTVAYFTSTGSLDSPNNYRVTVNWGDGLSSSAQVVVDSGNSNQYDVTAIHTYGTSGTFPVTVSINDTANTSRSATVASTAIVAPAPTSMASVGDLGSFLLSSFDALSTKLVTNVYSNQLPLVGRQLAQTGPGTFPSDWQSSCGVEFDYFNLFPGSDVTHASGLQLALFEALGPSGLNVLQDSDSDGKVDLNDVAVQVNSSNVTFSMHLHEDAANNTGQVGFKTGLPGVPLKFPDTHSVRVGVGYDMPITFGVNTSGTYSYFINATTLGIHVTAGAAGMHLHSQDNLLTEDVTDDPSNPSSLAGDYTVQFDTGSAGQGRQ
jgi:hypothetical protein